MLVLTRRKEEVIHIGDEITITVLRIKGKSVRIGIEAPKHYSILRGELEQQCRGEEPVVYPSHSTLKSAAKRTAQSTSHRSPKTENVVAKRTSDRRLPDAAMNPRMEMRSPLRAFRAEQMNAPLD